MSKIPWKCGYGIHDWYGYRKPERRQCKDCGLLQKKVGDYWVKTAKDSFEWLKQKE